MLGTDSARLVRASIAALVGAALAALVGPALAAPAAEAAPTVSLQAPARAIASGHAARLTGRISSGGARARVTLQARVGGRWRSVAHARASRGSRFRFTRRVRGAGGHVFRVEALHAKSPAVQVLVAGRRTVTSHGGQVRLSLGGLKVTAPRGAIRAGKRLTVQIAAGAPGGVSLAGGPYRITTSQGEPARAVTLSFKYDAGLLASRSRPVVVHDRTGHANWTTEPSRADATHHTVTARILSFSVVDVIDAGAFWAGKILGDRTDLPKGCTSAPGWIDGVTMPDAPQDALPMCIANGSDDAKVLVSVVNNRGYAQIVRISGASFDLHQSRFAGSVDGQFAKVWAQLASAQGSGMFVLGPGEGATVAIKRPATQPIGNVDVHIRAAAHDASAVAAVAWALLNTAKDAVGVPVAMTDCVLRTVYNATADDRGSASALAQIRACTDAANGLAAQPRAVLASLAKGLLVDDFFFKLVDLQFGDLNAPDAGFTIPGRNPTSAGIAVNGDLGQVPAGKHSDRLMTASGGTPPYRFAVWNSPANTADVPGWVTVSPDGRVSIDPPATFAGRVSFYVYASDSAGQHSPFARDRLTFDVVPGLAASVAGGGGLTWTARTIYLPSGSTGGLGVSLSATACTPDGLCATGDANGNILVATDPPSGGWASHPVSDTGITALSCPAQTLCVATDSRGSVFTSRDAFTLHPTWTTTQLGAGYLTGVSCPTTTLCVATGIFDTILSTTDPTGGSAAWHAVSGSLTRFRGVSCATASLCVAVSDTGDAFTATNPTGPMSAWRRTPVIAPTAFGGLVAVACPSSALCVAVDHAGDIATTTDPVAGSWSAVSVPDTLHAVACSSSSMCAVSGNTNVWVATTPTGDAPSWSQASGASSLNQPPLISAGCSASGVCVAGGDDGTVATSTDPATGFLRRPIDASAKITDVSCATRQLCVAVTVNGDALSSANAFSDAPTWNQESLASVDSQRVFASVLNAVSCAADGFCGALSANNVVFTRAMSSGVGWAGVQLPTGSYDDVACMSPTLCVAVGLDPATGTGVVATSQDPGTAGSWRIGTVPGAGDLTSISCPSAGFCAAIDNTGHVATTASPSAGSAAWTLSAYGSGNGTVGHEISCASAAACVIADDRLHTSTRPAAGPWTAPTDVGQQINRVSCANAGLCVAVGSSPANVYAATDPFGVAPTWVKTLVSARQQSSMEGSDAFGGPTAISCTADGACLAVTVQGDAIAGRPGP
jgi:hypothetical protein